MPRRRVPLDCEAPYHVTDRCLNQEWFALSMDIVWSIMEDYLSLAAHHFEVRLHAFVLMSNHFHLIISAPRGNLSDMLAHFLRETSREISRLTGRINQTWGGRNHKTNLVSYHHFMNTYKYVYRNPVRAKMCALAEEYPYSTLHGLCGLRRLVIPIVEDTLLFSPSFDESVLTWLNTKSPVEADESMKLALRRAVFELPRHEFDRTPNQLETRLL